MHENKELVLAYALDELRRRQAEVQFQGYYGTASPKQVEFHGAETFGRVLLGGNRSGKTHAGAMESIQWCHYSTIPPYMTPGGRKLPKGPVHVRVVCPDLPGTLDEKHVQRDKIRELCPSHWLRGEAFLKAYSVIGHTFHFANSSVLELMSSEQAVDKHAGQSLNAVWFDEEMPRQIFTENLARLDRSMAAWWLTYTPIIGLKWIYDSLYIPALRGNPNLRLWILDVEDNRKNLGKGFIENLEAGLSDDEKKIRLRGRYSISTGLVYDVFSDQHEIDGIEIEVH